MKKTLVLALLCLTLGLGSAWANITGTTNANAAWLDDQIDWCVNLGCLNDYNPYPTPSVYFSDGGTSSGLYGLVGGSDFYNTQQGVTWFGGFADGMGLLYNGASFGNSPAPFGFEPLVGRPVGSIGAWIEANYDGPFVATLDLYGSSGYLGQVGYDGAPGAALFIGAHASEPIAFAVFAAYGVGPNEPDFSIGTVKLGPVPEPGTLAMLGSGIIGLAGLLRRKTT